jgi:hypothetical protein
MPPADARILKSYLPEDRLIAPDQEPQVAPGWPRDVDLPDPTEIRMEQDLDKDLLPVAALAAQRRVGLEEVRYVGCYGFGGCHGDPI